jgi:hypothetical protein
MPIFSEIEEGRAEKKYSSPEIDDVCVDFFILFFLNCKMIIELSLKIRTILNLESFSLTSSSQNQILNKNSLMWNE